MDQFSLLYSDDNKKNTLNNGGNKEHGLKDVTSKEIFVLVNNYPMRN